MRQRACKNCGNKEKKLSRSGYCADCSAQRLVDSVRELKAKKGPKYEKWKKGMKKFLKKL